MKNKNPEILIVEDNPGDVRLLRELFAESNTGCQVSVSETLSEAIAKLEAAVFDIVLLDLSLPDSHGLDTYTKLRDHGADVPIVILTGLNDQEIGTRAVGEGAQDFLVKGHFDSGLLVRAVRYAIERNKLRLRMLELQDQVIETERTRTMAETAIAAAHQIRQPLTSVVGFAQILEDSEQDPDRLELLERIIEASNLIDEIVGKIFKAKKYVTVPYAGGVK
jgi:DNA-binding response OmpR family regulator